MNIAKIEGFIFSDGVILEVNQMAGEITIKFQDYRSNAYVIVLAGVQECFVGDYVAISVHTSRTRRMGSVLLLELFDDDCECLFKAAFAEATINHMGA
jgi:hypothetical protein